MITITTKTPIIISFIIYPFYLLDNLLITNLYLKLYHILFKKSNKILKLILNLTYLFKKYLNFNSKSL